MVTFLIITTSILVGVGVKLHLDKLDLATDNDLLNIQLSRKNLLIDTSLREKEFVDLKYNLYKTEAEKIHEELNQKVTALELSNESLANAYYTNCIRFGTLNQQINDLKNKLKKERNKAKQIKYDKQNDTIVDPEYLTELGEL